MHPDPMRRSRRLCYKMSTSFVKFTPILDDTNISYLLQIDDSRILLDCGWDFANTESLREVAKIASSIDAILLTHADLEHLGGYAYAVARLGLECPCYATTPVHDMGLQMIQDVLASKLAQREFPDLTTDEVAKAFGKITLLRYSQPYTLSGKCAGIVISAFGAGHTIGGLSMADVRHRVESQER